jgi:CBS domain containing-hemolysin-like protein
MSKQKEVNNKKDASNWAIKIFITTFLLSILFSYISTNGVTKLSIVPATLILIFVILIGILFDMIGVAVTVANEEEFHAKATKKVEGSKTSIKLIKNASRVANVCADVIGDICGVLSGAIGAIISARIVAVFGLSENIQFIISAVVASITVGGKAFGKEIANKNSTKIVHMVGIFLGKFDKKKN